jgi:hypothetical protein
MFNRGHGAIRGPIRLRRVFAFVREDRDKFGQSFFPSPFPGLGFQAAHARARPFASINITWTVRRRATFLCSGAVRSRPRAGVVNE